MAVSCFIIALFALVTGVASKVPANIAEQFLHTALKAQGTSQTRIIDVLSYGSGDPQSISKRLNSEIKATILEANGDVIRVNLSGLKQVLGNTAELFFKEQYQNPSLSSTLRPKFDELLEAHSDDLKAWIDRYPIPLSIFTEARRQKLDGALNIVPSVPQVLSVRITDAVGDLLGMVGSILQPALNSVGHMTAETPRASKIAGAGSSEIKPITSEINSLISTIGPVLSPFTDRLSYIFAYILKLLTSGFKCFLRDVLKKLQCNLGKALLSPVLDLSHQWFDTRIPCDGVTTC